MAGEAALILGNNIKVHFAGSDGEEASYAALNAAKANYRLYSCYKYIAKRKTSNDFKLPPEHVIRVQCAEQKHVIQDSGLFTLMFGSGKQQKQTLESLTSWQDKLIEFVKQNSIFPIVVEIDCQKILNPDAAWYLRERMRKLMPDRRQINVFHFEDGRDGLDRLIDFSDYIALSVPEFRSVRRATHRKDLQYITNYIKNKKPEIDIHLLGCTDIKILKENSFCTSSDSTSWLSGVKYGYINDGFKREHICHFKKEIFEMRRIEVKNQFDKRGVIIRGKMLDYATNSSLCASICKNSYSRVAGPQD